MAVIHIDADRFFLAVHARNDPSLCDVPDAPPVALYQYNDVICASSSARALGVRKHMAPDAARALLVPAGGRLVHAYWREWPGPRIWCKSLGASNQPPCPSHVSQQQTLLGACADGPYQQASRELFAAIRAALDECAATRGAALERASIDEGYIRLGGAAAAEAAAAAGGRLGQEEEEGEEEAEVGGRRRGGEARRGSGGAGGRGAGAPRARRVRSGGPLRRGPEPAARQACLGAGQGGGGARRRAGVGGGRRGGGGDAAARDARAQVARAGRQGRRAGAAGLASAADLRALEPAQLQARLGLAEGAAAAAHARCRGRCDAPVAASPPKSASVTSWLAHDLLRDLALTRHLGRGGPGVRVGGWLFEPHRGACKSNETRARWVLLALCLDLEERLAHHALEHAELPTKLSLCWQGCGASPTPGPGHRAGPTHSRTTPLSPAAFARRAGAAAAAAAAARGGVPYLQSDRGASGEEVISPATLVLDGATAAERAAAVSRLEQAAAGTREARVAALVRAAAACSRRGRRSCRRRRASHSSRSARTASCPAATSRRHRASGAAAGSWAAGSPQPTIRALLGLEPPPATTATAVTPPARHDGHSADTCTAAAPGLGGASGGASARGSGGSACVVHLDIDNFYCAVEVADEPALRGVPLAVTQGNAGGFVAPGRGQGRGIRKGDGVGERPALHRRAGGDGPSARPRRARGAPAS